MMVWSSICAVCSPQTVMHWSDAPKLRTFGTESWSLESRPNFQRFSFQHHPGGDWARVKNAQGIYRNWLKDVTSTKVDIFLLFVCGCHLCCCTCLKSGSVNVWLSQWTRDSHIPAQWLAALPRDKRDAVWCFPVSLEYHHRLFVVVTPVVTNKVGVVSFDANILVCNDNMKCISYCIAMLYWLNWTITTRKGKHTNTWLIVYISRLTNQPVKYIHTTWQLTMQLHNHILSRTHSTTFKNMSTVWVKFLILT